MFGGYENDIIVPLVMYRIADPTMLPVWLARQPEYKTVIHRLSIRITHLRVSHNCSYGIQANSNLFLMHLPFWLRAQNRSLKPNLPKLKEIDVLIHCTTISFVGTWIKGKLPTASCHVMITHWKKELAM